MSDWKNNRANGWGRGLYRDSDEGWLAGVSQGLAQYSGLPAGLVRVGWFIAFLYLNMLAVLLYVVAWVLLEDRPSGQLGKKARKRAKKSQFYSAMDEQPSNAYAQASDDELLSKASAKAQQIDERLRAMESYVTSKKYRLQREFDRL